MIVPDIRVVKHSLFFVSLFFVLLGRDYLSTDSSACSRAATEVLQTEKWTQQRQQAQRAMQIDGLIRPRDEVRIVLVDAIFTDQRIAAMLSTQIVELVHDTCIRTACLLGQAAMNGGSFTNGGYAMLASSGR